MTDRERAENASGHPGWERSGVGASRLPASSAPDRREGREGEGREAESRNVATWLGWSPTSWRARGSK